MCAWGRGSRSVFQFEDAAGDVTQRPVLYIALVFNTELLRSCNLGHMAILCRGPHFGSSICLDLVYCLSPAKSDVPS